MRGPSHKETARQERIQEAGATNRSRRHCCFYEDRITFFAYLAVVINCAAEAKQKKKGKERNRTLEICDGLSGSHRDLVSYDGKRELTVFLLNIDR